MDAQTDAMQQIDTRPADFDFESCFHTNYARIARAIARIVGDPGRAEELAVEAFWKLWRTPQAHGENAGGWLYRTLGIDVAFTWKGVVIASAVMSFPLLVRSARSAFEEVDPRLPAVARTLGRGPLGAFLAVELPLAWRGVAGGTVLSFARALGEFGATILVAGNIPGRTQTLALALFQEVQMGRDRAAAALAGIAALLAAGALAVADALVRRRERRLEE